MKSTVLMMIAVLIGVLVLVGLINGCGSDLVYGAERGEKLSVEEIIIEDLKEPVSAVSDKRTVDVPIIEIPLLPTKTYFGNCRITFYCPNSCCCGIYASGYTASGAPVQANHTIANGLLPFGTKVMIDDVVYTVEDRGVGGDQFDIFVWSHDEALARGMYYRDVWIVG